MSRPVSPRRFALLPVAAYLAVAGVVIGFAPRLAADEIPAPGTLLLVAGDGYVQHGGDGGPALDASFVLPWGLAMDATGQLLVADGVANRIRRIGSDGRIDTIAGTGQAGGFGGDGGPALDARLNGPFGICFDAAGNLYIGDAFNERVRRVSPDGIITTVAGSGRAGFLGDGSPASEARLNKPGFPLLDAEGTLYISDLFNHRVRRMRPDGRIETVAGGGRPADRLGDGGTAVEARLQYPYGLALDPEGRLLIADARNRRVRRVESDGRITTVAGGGNPADGVGDGGPATEARLLLPTGVAVDPGGNLFIVDNPALRVRKVTPDGRISTVAGSGQAGSSGVGGPATEAALNGPTGLALDGRGNLYITDAGPGDGLVIRVVATRVLKVVGVAVPR
jgi:sugar lactone lactonase YvrE